MTDDEKHPGTSWWPIRCPECEGTVLPLSDYGPEGSAVMFKAWVCIHLATCGWGIRIDRGQVTSGRMRPDARESRRA